MSDEQEKRERRGLSPWLPLAPLRQEMGDLFSRFWGDDEGWLSEGMVASLDLTETDDAVEVRIDLPGVSAKDVDVQVRGGTLTVCGERKEENIEEDTERKVHRIERRHGSFSRSIPLPCQVNEEEAEANFHDGVLTITLPKSEETRPKKIEVKE